MPALARMGSSLATPFDVLQRILTPGKIANNCEADLTTKEKDKLKSIEERLFGVKKETKEDTDAAKPFLLKVVYQALLKEECSTAASMEALAKFSRDKNEKLKIGGCLYVIDPFATNYLVEQVIEGDLLRILELFLKIKADERVVKVTKVNFSFNTVREYKSWGMTFRLGKEESWAKSFLRDAAKHKIIHECKRKLSFIVEDIRTQNHYMLKEYTKSSESGKNFVSQAVPYANEVRMLQHINKERCCGGKGRRGICPVPDVFHELVRVSIIYPMFEMDLFSLLENYTVEHQRDSLAPELIRVYFMQMLVILKTLKGVNMIHRDIKPENFCIDEDGCLVLIDFELALVLNIGDNVDYDGLHQSRNVIVGTPQYLPPETLTDLVYSYQSDLWAVACTVCDMCSPETPFGFWNSMNIQEIKDAITDQVPRRAPGIDDSLWTLLEKILCSVEDRITLEEVMDDEYFDKIRDSDPFDKSNPVLSAVVALNEEFGLTKKYRGYSVLDDFRSLQKYNSGHTISNDRENHFNETAASI